MFDSTKFTRVELIKLIEIMSVLESACEERKIKFNKFTDEQWYELFRIYRAYRLSDSPPF